MQPYPLRKTRTEEKKTSRKNLTSHILSRYMGAASPGTNHELGIGMVLYVIRTPNPPMSPTYFTPTLVTTRILDPRI